MTSDYKRTLLSFVEVVVFLLAAFGGFLKKIAPPEQTGAQYAVGILSFLILIALLIISAVARAASAERFRKQWLISGTLAFAVALPSAVWYPRVLAQHTWWYPPEKPEKRLCGLESDWTPQVREFVIQHQADEHTPEELARNFEISQIWTAESIQNASTTLLVSYSFLVLSLATAIFCLLEANGRSGVSVRSAEDGPDPPPTRKV